MTTRTIPLLLAAALLLIAAGASAASTAEITVMNYSIEPAYLFSGDTGKLTITIQNTGSAIVDIYSADLDPPAGIAGFKVLNDMTYDSVGSIGPGDSRSFTFTFTADVPDGVYYPKFYLDLSTQGSFRQYVPVEVKSTGLTVAVSKFPDAFNEGVKSKVNISVGNPRQGMVNGITITPSGDGATITPETAFIGSLAPDASRETVFEITPSGETTVRFLVSYRNGMNDHSETVTLPIRFSEDKRSADPVLNNVQISSTGQYSTITGDINNAGLSYAYSTTVTVGSPATPVDPNRIYVVGELEPDDFSSFEVTYTGSAQKIPVIVTYKDTDGNSFSRTFEVTASSGGIAPVQGSGAASASGSSGTGTPGSSPGGNRGGGFLFGTGSRSGAAPLPLMEAGIALIVVLSATALAWKKGYLRRLRERLSRGKKSEDDDDLPHR